MSSPALRNDVHIDHGSSAAICAEIGDRLRIGLKGASGRLPKPMLMLIEQMARNDRVSTVLIPAEQLVMLRPNQNAEVAK
jgi:hypothetical protein